MGHARLKAAGRLGYGLMQLPRRGLDSVVAGSLSERSPALLVYRKAETVLDAVAAALLDDEAAARRADALARVIDAEQARQLRCAARARIHERACEAEGQARMDRWRRYRKRRLSGE